MMTIMAAFEPKKKLWELRKFQGFSKSLAFLLFVEFHCGGDFVPLVDTKKM